MEMLGNFHLALLGVVAKALSIRKQTMRRSIFIMGQIAAAVLMVNSDGVFADESICVNAFNVAAGLVGTPNRAEKQPPFLQISHEQYASLLQLIQLARRGDSKEKIKSGLSLPFRELPIQAKGFGAPVRGYMLNIDTHKEDKDFSNTYFDKSLWFIFDVDWRLACIESDDIHLNPTKRDDLLINAG